MQVKLTTICVSVHVLTGTVGPKQKRRATMMAVKWTFSHEIVGSETDKKFCEDGRGGEEVVLVAISAKQYQSRQV